jgi:serine protease inhibitor
MENALVTSQNRFGFKLYAELARKDSARNLFISPASVMLALAMTYAGARGETRRALAETLELEGIDDDQLGRAAADLLVALRRTDSRVILSVANSLWARAGLALRPDFIRRAEQSFDAKVNTLDFARGDAAGAVNDWVRKQTRGKIEAIVDRLPPEALLVLINAVYFKADWARQFDRRASHEGAFRLPGGGQKQVMMMVQSGTYRYYQARDVQAVALPYGGGHLSMYVFLPGPRSDLEAFARLLQPRRWNAWMDDFHETDGRIELPRFKLAYEASLIQPLHDLGMAVAFGERADFAGICDSGRVQVDDVRHKALMEVNEEGTEAAAATSVTMVLTSFAPKRTFSMVVDRPFFCAIRDDRSGAILFMGAIVDPVSPVTRLAEPSATRAAERS